MDISNNLKVNLIKEINLLWNSVYPYLAKQIEEIYGEKDGEILEIGPFCGVIFSLIENNTGNSFSIAAFPREMGGFFLEEARKRGLEKRIRIIETDPNLKEIEDEKIDLAIFRGAFFFPSLFEVNFNAIYRILKSEGLGFIGGGFGRYTPNEVIQKIGARSRELNLEIGKVEVNEEKLWENIKRSKINAKFEMIREGGLWVVMKKHHFRKK